MIASLTPPSTQVSVTLFMKHWSSEREKILMMSLNFVENELLVKLAASINKMHAKEVTSGHKRSEFSPLSPLTPLSIVMPGMADADPLGLLGGDTTESSSSAQSSSAAQPTPESKRQKKLAKKPKRVMIRG
jgi:hypothetical protein